MRGKLLILILAFFGITYSVYLAAFLEDFYVGMVFSLITIGLSSTIYILDKKINYRIIFYIWLAIILVAVVLLLFQWTTGFFESFRI